MNFSALHPTLDKCKVAGIGVLKNVNVRLAGIKIANLTRESIKILGVHVSYEEKVQDDLNFCKFIKKLMQCYNAMAYQKTVFGKQNSNF